jgi:magnesium-protoporphyrin IX monomethyl ester (oxidative) cyclase
MKKDIDKAQIKEAFRLLRKNKIQSFAYFMIGYATEDEKTITQTINFAKELNPDWAMFTAVTPLPCTELFEMAVQQKLVSEEYWKEYSLGEQKGRFPYFVKNTDKWVRKAYRKFYLRPGFILDKILSLRNWDTLRNYIRGTKGIIFFKQKL